MNKFTEKINELHGKFDVSGCQGSNHNEIYPTSIHLTLTKSKFDLFEIETKYWLMLLSEKSL